MTGPLGVEHCDDLLPHEAHEWLDGVRRAECPGVERAPERAEAPEPAPRAELPEALGMTDPSTAHTHVVLDPAPMFTEADLA